MIAYWFFNSGQLETEIHLTVFRNKSPGKCCYESICAPWNSAFLVILRPWHNLHSALKYFLLFTSSLPFHFGLLTDRCNFWLNVYFTINSLNALLLRKQPRFCYSFFKLKRNVYLHTFLSKFMFLKNLICAWFLVSSFQIFSCGSNLSISYIVSLKLSVQHFLEVLTLFQC